MKIAGMTQYIITFWEGSKKTSMQIGTMNKHRLIDDLKSQYERFTVDTL